MKYDIIGDIHGCYNELCQLLKKLGYTMDKGIPLHPSGRSIAFVGDAADRGPESIQTIELMFRLQDENQLIYSPGNHCNKLYRYVKGNKIQLQYGIETTVAELNSLSNKSRLKFIERYIKFYEALPLYYSLDNGKLIIAHAGIREDLIGTTHTKKLRSFVLYGDVTGEILPNGRPLRRDWAKQYTGEAFIVYGHTPVEHARFINNTVNIDTGCVFGGRLSALRYPEKEIVSVPSFQPFIADRFTTFP
ncbi:bis(5'-nucleosyl)-tetraphosphatase PrpE [Sporosarcina sp. G11-34]|uniref:bis(5'-nucleosyl)-tetraphosphatase PrpE n=1 Tax=Sporosarcina sp. G11-34 TaxID=2849605 RepID=UPI0022A966CF|nr:bis(5'-nucleosyl)-tetraphosphatase PrpE [Sporosarcina sp. G11-34]MCZ2257212.1 bis(5'-nucleosyl)-tetraphosphatase PrpE [Sporosarcina sp. G11-34]